MSDCPTHPDGQIMAVCSHCLVDGSRKVLAAHDEMRHSQLVERADAAIAYVDHGDDASRDRLTALLHSYRSPEEPDDQDR